MGETIGWNAAAIGDAVGTTMSLKAQLSQLGDEIIQDLTSTVTPEHYGGNSATTLVGAVQTVHTGLQGGADDMGNHGTAIQTGCDGMQSQDVAGGNAFGGICPV